MYSAKSGFRSRPCGYGESVENGRGDFNSRNRYDSMPLPYELNQFVRHIATGTNKNSPTRATGQMCGFLGLMNLERNGE